MSLRVKTKSCLKACIRSYSSAEKRSTPVLSFRAFLKALEKQNDLTVIDTEVDPYLEVAAIARRCYELPSKAPLMNNPKGKDGNGLFRLFGCPNGLRKNREERYGRMATTLGLEANATPQEIANFLAKVPDLSPNPPEKVDETDSPVKQNKLFGDDIDFSKMPVPKLHDFDGGKYIMTYGIHVATTPDGKWTNWSIARAMVCGKNKMVGVVVLPQHIAQIHKMWADIGKDMPWAVFFGGPPAANTVAGMPLPAFVSEGDYVGALSGESVKVVKCETNDQYVPADSEIVFEGTISATEKADEGPMGEYHGYMFPSESHKFPLMTVNAITYRDDPIMPFSVAGKAPDESNHSWGILASAELLRVLRDEHKLPIKMVWSPWEAHTCWMVVQVDNEGLRNLHTTPEEFCTTVGRIIFASQAGIVAPKVIIVGEDIDITNIEEVVWALSTRRTPGISEFVFNDIPNFPLNPFMSHGAVEKPNWGHKAVYNALFPFEFEKPQNWAVSNFHGAYPKEVQEKVLSNWKKYGFTD
ncbi:hypothetical protein PACTADRAFT_59926 [Pachysolen tannophilus NRRL Y-2460]|uniref:Ferulic acid decarboxylase 1 n=1 Tax=Pachysolen tannophilus NRRL Y-2460 TaxID=669874 RepID=A0A1E4TQI9_PACTA|nr:hypothetical protein PACTADRAFT_59926 [Pachysolen tannophilus NRRL Y-2460]